MGRHQAGSQRGALRRVPQQWAELTRVTEHLLRGIAVAEAKVRLGVTNAGSRLHDRGRIVVAGWLQRRHCTGRQLPAEHQQGVGQVASRSPGPSTHDAPGRFHRLTAVPAGERRVGEQRVEQARWPLVASGAALRSSATAAASPSNHRTAALRGHMDRHTDIGAFGHQLAHATRIAECRPAAERPHE